MPTGVASGYNEIKQHRNFSETHFPGVAPCRIRLDGHDVVINKGSDRDIDRDAVNMLITFLLDGEYQVVVVDKLTDLTSDLSDLEEFLNDAAAIGMSVFELFTMQVRHHVYMEGCPEC